MSGTTDAPIVLIDIGNTSIKLAVHHREQVKLTHLNSRASDAEIASAIDQLLEQLPSQALASSVVPAVDKRISAILNKNYKTQLLLVPKDVPVPLHIRYTPPQSLGSDRLIAAFAARKLIDCRTLLILDCGTAITLDCVQDETFMGGFILPGPILAHATLHDKTAQLPNTHILDSQIPFALGYSTQTCIQYGIAFGYEAMIEGLIAKTREALGGDVYVVATGGFLNNKTLFKGIDTRIDNIVLKGLGCLANIDPTHFEH